MSEEAKRIKEHYIKPAISLVETDYELQRIGSRFEVLTTIWVNILQPYYDISIPEDVTWRKDTTQFCIASDWQPGRDISIRKVRYIPTGRTVYDNSKIHAEAVAFEYVLEMLQPGFKCRMCGSILGEVKNDRP